jgi:cellulose synthase/poly-beta-1,6-N-acetylglucosamine synthase-like glycosyltransferase
MAILTAIYLIIAGLVVFQLILPFLTVLFSQVFGRERLKTKETSKVKDYDYGCIITAYRNSAIAKPLIHSLLQQKHQNHIIYLVADECPDFDFGINDPRFVYLKPEPLRLKAKSIIHAMENYKRPHDYTVIFDADNLAHPDFLSEINKYANSGFSSIQGQRTAKNLDSTIAAADSLGELYKNFIERYAPYLNGGSAVISGSGMAVETNLYWEYLRSPEIEQGKHLWKKMLQEDKILQNFLLRRNEIIAYAWNAICYDEKVESVEGVQTQRSRWLFSYFQNVPNALGILRRGLFNLSTNQLYFGLVTISLPMFLQLALAFGLAVLGLFFSPFMTLILVVSVAIFALNVLWTMKLSDAPPAVWNAIKATPAFIWRQFTGMFKMGDPNKNFKHSEHTKMVSVEDLLGKNK